MDGKGQRTIARFSDAFVNVLFVFTLFEMWNVKTITLQKEESKMANNNDNNKMSREEAGRKGGEKTSQNHDKEFYQEIGQKGGEATSRNHDKEFYQENGEKGGRQRRSG